MIRKANQPTDNNHQGTMNTPMNPFNQFRSEHPLSAMEPRSGGASSLHVARDLIPGVAW